MSRELPTWIDSPAEVAGLLLLATGLALTALAVAARIVRDQPVSLLALSGLAVAGAVVYTGHRLGGLRASRDSLEVDLSEEPDRD